MARYKSGGGAKTWAEQYLKRAKSFLGTNDLWSFHEEFLTAEAWVGGGSGTGFVEGVTDLANGTDSTGGVVHMQTGTGGAVGDYGRYYLQGNFGNTFDHNSSSVKFYRAARLKFFTVGDSNQQSWYGSHVIRCGIIGQNNATKATVHFDTPGGARYLTSVEDLTTDWLFLEHGYDGTDAFVIINRGTPTRVAASGWWPIHSNGAFPDMRAGRVAAGATTNYRLMVDWVLYAGTRGA